MIPNDSFSQNGLWLWNIENLTKYFVDLHISLESKIFTYYCTGKIFHQSTYNNEYIVLVDGEVKDLITI